MAVDRNKVADDQLGGVAEALSSNRIPAVDGEVDGV